MLKAKERISQLKKLPWTAILAAAYAAAVLVWAPWYAQGYLHIAQDKLIFFLGTTILAGVLLAVVVPEKADVARWKKQGIAAAVYAAATLLSVLLSGNIAATLWASGGYLGGFVLTAGALLACMGTAVFLKNAESLVLPYIISGAGVALLGICNNFGADPLGFRTQIQESQYNLFFSTIGNADYLSAFLCLWLPLAIYHFAAEKQMRKRAVAFVCTMIGFLCMASLDSGLTALGLAGAIFLLLLFIPLTVEQVSRYAFLAAGWIVAQFSMGQMAEIWPLLRTEHPFAVLTKPVPAASLTAVFLLAAAFFARLKKKAVQKTFLKEQRVFCAALTVAAVTMLVLANRFHVSFGGLDNFLQFGPDWATGRGAIWADVWFCFMHGTPMQILFGRGPGMVHASLIRMGESLPYALTDTIGAHNEYLELLLTTGLAGLAAYLAFLGCALHTAYKLLRNVACKRGWLFCVLAYLVQAFFNNRVTAVFPLFMVLTGVLTSEQEERATDCTAKILMASMLLAAAGTFAGNILLHYLLV